MSNELMTMNSGLNVMSRIGEFQQVAKLFAESGMFQDAKGAAQCFVKIMAGAELGIPPFTAMSAFHVIQGKPVMAANTIAARLKASGKYDYRITEKNADRCTIDFFQASQKVYTETWDVKRAAKAGVKNMDKYPEAMLFARCITAGARAIAPDVVGQFYTPDELGAEVDADGVIINAPVDEPVKPEPASNGKTLPSTDERIAKLLAWFDSGKASINEGNRDSIVAKVDTLAHDIGFELPGMDTPEGTPAGRLAALVAHIRPPQAAPEQDSHMIVLQASH
jgi:hypothetical protein